MPAFRRIQVTEGDIFGRLTVIAEIAAQRYQRRGRFKCVCGNVIDRDLYNVMKGHTKSCGCLKRNYNVDTKTIHGNAVRRTPEYVSWCHMKERCANPLHSDYSNYGGRGVTVCDRWRNFKNFLEDMGRRPSIEHTLDRKNVNGHYEPDNCFWGDRLQQGRNKRNIWMVEIDGNWETVVAVAERLGVSSKTIRYRNRGRLKRLGELLQPLS